MPIIECPPIKIVLLEKYSTENVAKNAPMKPETPMKYVHDVVVNGYSTPFSLFAMDSKITSV